MDCESDKCEFYKELKQLMDKYKGKMTVWEACSSLLTANAEICDKMPMTRQDYGILMRMATESYPLFYHHPNK